MLDFANTILEKDRLNSLIMRDFDTDNSDLSAIFYSNGFFKVDLPNRNIIYNLDQIDPKNFVESLTPRSRRHFRNDVLKFEHLFEIKTSSSLSTDNLKRAYELYKNVGAKNLALNIFPYPFKLFKLLNESEDWEFITIKLDEILVAVGFCYHSGNSYFPVLVGLDYTYNYEYKVYKQMLYQVVLRAMELGCRTVHFGLSADTEKRKLGAIQIQNCGFMEIKDNFSFEILNNISV